MKKEEEQLSAQKNSHKKTGKANTIREINQKVDNTGKGIELQVLTYGCDLAPYMVADFMIGTVPTRGLIDCGAVPNVLQLSLYQNVKQGYELQPSSNLLRGVTGDPVPAEGTVKLPCRLGQEKLIINFLVVSLEKFKLPGKLQVLLGVAWLRPVGVQIDFKSGIL